MSVVTLRLRRRGVLVALAAGLLCLLTAGVAYAYWTALDNSHAAGATADSLPAGNSASATASGNTVTIVFPRATTSAASGSTALTSYTVKRYSSGSTTTAANTFTCSQASGSTITCTENNVPDGSWIYTDTPFLGSWVGGESSKTVSAVTVDTVAPLVSVNAFTNNATSSTSPAFSGNAGTAPGDQAVITVKVFAGSGVGGALQRTLTTTASGGAWSAAWSGAALPANAQYTVQVSQSDAAGNVGAATSTFVVDTTAPTPTVTSFSNNATNNTTPTFSGTAGQVSASATSSADSATVTVKVFAGSSATGTALQTFTPSVVAGSWSVAASAALSANARYTVLVSQSDAAGNAGTATSTFVVDTAVPAPTVNSFANNATNSTTPSFSGGAGQVAASATSSADQTGITVKVFAGSGVGGALQATLTTTASGGAWSAPWSGTALPANATYTVQVSQSDGAGNIGTATSTFVVDTNAPTVTLTSPTANAVVSTATPTITGTAGSTGASSSTSADQAATIKIFSGTGITGTPVQTLTATGPGNYSVTATALTNGTYTVQATQTDGAGNRGSSAAVTFTVSLAPAVAVTWPANSSFINTTTPTFTGNAGTATGDGGVTVKVYSGATTGGTLLQTLTATVNGSSWSAVANPALSPNAQYTVQATQANSGGTVGISNANTFVIDTTAPSNVTVSTPTNRTGGNGKISGTAGVVVQSTSSSADGTTVTIKIYDAGGTLKLTLAPSVNADGTWSVSYGSLKNNNDYTATVTQTDGAGNSTSASVTWTQ